MEPREWNNIINKSSWDRGEWDTEPDKLQWQDDATGLPCLIIRSSVTGALCGYVGVPENHPAFGLNYNGYTQEDNDAYHQAIHDKWRKEYEAKKEGIKIIEELGSIEPPPVVKIIGEKIVDIKVHGGLTFSGACSAPTEEKFHKMQGSIEDHIKQAKIYPKGDSAEWLDIWAWCLNNYEDWKNQWISMSIYHTDTQKVWWFGFDCAHSLDSTPKITAALRALDPAEYDLPALPQPDWMNEIYKNIDYAKRECASLAQQLKAMMPN